MGADPSARSDIVVIGASAGGIEALSAIVGGLPADLPASIFVALHLPSSGSSRLAEILDRQGPLPCRAAVDGEPLRAGTIVVALPDRHLTLSTDAVRVTHGPRVNGHRPSVDLLFHSAARSFGSRVVGVVLSGTLSDGTLGLNAIKRRSGIAVVQADAVHQGMPTSAIANVDVDHVLPAHEIAAALTMIVCAGEEATVDEQPREQVADTELEQGFDLDGRTDPPGAPSVYRCPECGGPLWHLEDGMLDGYACHVGHVYSADSLVDALSEDVERALWTAVRTLEEKADLTHRLAERLSPDMHRRSKARFHEQAEEAATQADLLRRVLVRSPEPTGVEDE